MDGVGITPGNPLPSTTTNSVNGPSSSGWDSLLAGVGNSIPNIVNGIFGNPNQGTVNNPTNPNTAPASYGTDNTTTYLIIGGVVLAALITLLFVFKKK